MKYKCPCCGYYTLSSKGEYDICKVCFWEDDPIQSDNPLYFGGANDLSLLQSQENYKKFGAVEERFVKYVRKPRKDDTYS